MWGPKPVGGGESDRGPRKPGEGTVTDGSILDRESHRAVWDTLTQRRTETDRETHPETERETESTGIETEAESDRASLS